MHKEGNELCIIYPLIYGCFHGPRVHALGPCLLLLQSTQIKNHPVNISFLKENRAHSILKS